MNNNETINAAYTVAKQMLDSNPYISPEDTVCSVRARSGRIFIGASRMNYHAEVEAINNMQAAGEIIVDEFVLVGVQSGMQLLPCNNCAGYILSLHPENANCAVIMPDRAIRLADVGMFAANPSGPVNPPFAGVHTMNMAPPPVVPLSVPPKPQVRPVPVPVTEPEPEEPVAEPETEAKDDSESTENFNSNLLKSRVNDLLRAASDDDEEIDRITAKKKRFGFFRK